MLSATNITKSFQTNCTPNQVLRGVSVDIAEGEFLSIVGRSGSGKTTLLNVLSTLVRPDEGNLVYQGNALSSCSDSQLNRLRQADFSIIFQFHHLLPYMTVLENTLLPFMNTLKPISRNLHNKARKCLDRVGLGALENRLPGNLSGGEQQRVAIARALVKSSNVLFADEPTGSLDKETGGQIVGLMSDLNRDGLTVIMVTHDPEYAQCGNRTITMEDGLIVP